MCTRIKIPVTKRQGDELGHTAKLVSGMDYVAPLSERLAGHKALLL